MIGYFEDEAVNSYTEYLNMVESGKVKDTPAPPLAIDYYKRLGHMWLSHVCLFLVSPQSYVWVVIECYNLIDHTDVVANYRVSPN